MDGPGLYLKQKESQQSDLLYIGFRAKRPRGRAGEAATAGGGGMPQKRHRVAENGGRTRRLHRVD